MKILHVIHDFLPKHQAGSELYCFHICKELQAQGNDVRLFYSEIDHERTPYSIRQGEYQGLPFWEVINNHHFSSFEETYNHPAIEIAFARCLDVFQPEIVHYHHLLGLSYGCVRLCKERNIPTVFTLHDYWLTCPRGGGQRFRGEGLICHSVDQTLCAECISRYTFGIPRIARFLKKLLSWFERDTEGNLLSRMQKARISTLKRSFVSRGFCEIEGDSREVIFAHPPASLSLRIDIEPGSNLSFSIAMPPTVYEKAGDGVRFVIRCDQTIIYERFLHPKENPKDRGWHNELVSLNPYAGKRRELIFETIAHPTGQIDFCSACWGAPYLLQTKTAKYIPSRTSKVQLGIQRFLTRFQRLSLLAKVEKRARQTHILFNQVDLFIAPSRFLRNTFIEYGMDPSKIVLSDYGIFSQGYPPCPRRIEKPILFTYIGTLVAHKGLHVLIEAFNRLPKDSALLHVYGNTGEFTDYVQRIKAMIVHPGITLCGRAENSDIPKILSETDLLIVPSIWFENSPITIHEAFLAQVPVITSRFGGMADLVRDGENGMLFELGNANALYRCLIQCTENPDFIESIRPHPESVKTLEADAVGLMEMYTRLIQKE